ncbi:uncharacterized protein HMPREF1541_04178 [Cyphellophora europaea CBS 101466]|uniref:GH16 domain-containing protein n=1 Tax=Cyphellophora europaea (strain CBS 101466) TaxID=1220924 RepID=W2S0N2_CYPE1|nr:uncharacterized protein HMPREF1541_04178 [Cyphellophora europaea CBS 101466]ETN42237.1 hypothetical protein HMPREF1541_04178 [Cyphellophora europaea CBS 101466]
MLKTQILLPLLGWLACLVQAKLALLEDYSGKQFFQKMQFFSDPDPTQGHVKYLNMATANSTSLAGLIEDDGPNDTVFLGTDYISVTPEGRPSVRVQSKQTYNSGLFIADISHMPGGVCGAWPAFWLLGTAAPWPQAGEVDIIEGINVQTENLMALHVSGSFIVDNTSSLMSGALQSTDGDVASPVQPHNKGALVQAMTNNTFGAGFNANRGGVYATEVTPDSKRISIWFFPRGSIPVDITAGQPEPTSWGRPLANFAGDDLDFHSKFKSLKIIINLTFCGEWASKRAVWDASSCARLASTCEDYVSNHPEAFQTMYWAIRSLKVYEASNRNETIANVSDSRGSGPFANQTVPASDGHGSPMPTATALPKYRRRGRSMFRSRIGPEV